MRKDIELQSLGRQIRNLVTIPTMLPRLTTSLLKINNKIENENILARFTSVGHETIISELFKSTK
jgi:hypothetical protein